MAGTRHHDGVAKRCPRCALTLPVAEFPLRKIGKPTLSSWCRNCKGERLRLRYAALGRPRKRPLPPSPSVSWCSRCKSWLDILSFRPFSKSRTGCYAFCRDCEANARRLRESRPEYREHQSSKRRARHAEKPHLMLASCARRRAKKRSVKHDLTAAQWLQIVEEFGGRCAYCNRRSENLDMDHVVALGIGPHTADNVVPACRSCNASKGKKTLLQLLQRPHLLVTQRMLASASTPQPKRLLPRNIG
jgi:5-methylcytosine-specific restriction endonuclease McrA